MAEHAAEDQTEAPTAKRLERARESGNLPISRDVSVLAGLVGALFGATALMPAAIHNLTNQLAGFVGSVDHLSAQGVGNDGTVTRLLLSALAVVSTVGVPASVCAIISVVLQSNFYVGGAPIRFDFSRISPMAGFGRLLSLQNLVEFLKGLGRLIILVAVVWNVLSHNPLRSVDSVNWDLAAILPAASQQIEAFVRPLLIALAAFAAFDILLVRMRHTRRLRMTRDEVRLEMRDADGDPYVKAKLRRMREQRSKRRMMQKVKTAEVIITNPTHYSIALSYDRQRGGAPRIVAKGVDHMAMRIREEATAHGVPIMPNPPLARALYQLELDQEIPAEHYQAVAEVIAFVWKIRNRLNGPVS